MSKRVVVSLVDDFDGKAADETLYFSLDGVRYEIDLSKKNAQKLRGDMQRWVKAGRRIRGRRRRVSGLSVNRKDSSDIRQWARQSGFEVGSRGRIPVEVVDAFHAAR